MEITHLTTKAFRREISFRDRNIFKRKKKGKTSKIKKKRERGRKKEDRMGQWLCRY